MQFTADCISEKLSNWNIDQIIIQDVTWRQKDGKYKRQCKRHGGQSKNVLIGIPEEEEREKGAFKSIWRKRRYSPKE